MYNTAWEVHKPRRLHIASYRKLKRPAAGGRAGRSARTVGSQSFLSIGMALGTGPHRLVPLVFPIARRDVCAEGVETKDHESAYIEIGREQRWAQ